jgi:hypothetical protein
MPSSTLQQLVAADLKQSNALLLRYNSSSSLRGRERNDNRPKVCAYRRDRVALRLMGLNGMQLVDHISGLFRANIQQRPNNA